METKKCRKCGAEIPAGRVLSLCDKCIAEIRKAEKDRDDQANIKSWPKCD